MASLSYKRHSHTHSNASSHCANNMRHHNLPFETIFLFTQILISLGRADFLLCMWLRRSNVHNVINSSKLHVWNSVRCCCSLFYVWLWFELCLCTLKNHIRVDRRPSSTFLQRIACRRLWLAAVKRNETLRCCDLPIDMKCVSDASYSFIFDWSNLLGMMSSGGSGLKKQVGDVLRGWNDVFNFGPFCRTSHRGRAAIQTGLLHTLERWTSAHTLHTHSCARDSCNLQQICPTRPYVI